MDYQFNREVISPSFTKCSRTPTSREEVAEQLAAALARATVKPTVVPGFTGVAPRPPRSDRVDPDTKLKRRKIGGVPAGIRRDFEEARRDHEGRQKILAMVEMVGDNCSISL